MSLQDTSVLELTLLDEEPNDRNFILKALYLPTIIKSKHNIVYMLKFIWY